MATGNVSLRVSIQDAEVVRAALDKLGSDGEAALKKLDAASAHPAQGLTAVDKTVSGLKSRMEDMGQSLGPVGSLLMGFGPIGVAVAAGIGAAVAVFYEMSKAANELGDRATALRNFAEAGGVTTTVMQALSAEGTKFGLNGEQISQSLQRLAVSLGEAKRGTGALYDDLYRINPALAHQVAAAKDVASAYDAIGRAIRAANAAHDASGAASITRAAFGRNAGAEGLLAADVSDRGGVNSLASSFQDAGKALDDGLLKHLQSLKAQIEETNQRAKDIGASIFAEDVLQRELQTAEAFERIAAAAKELHDATKNESWGDFFSRKLTELGAFGAGEGGNLELSGQMQEAARQQALVAAARGRLAAGLQSGQQAPGLDNVWEPAGRGTDTTAAATKAAAAAKDAQVPIEAILSDTRKWMAVLGSAATPAEQLRLKILELNVAVKDHSASSQIAARAEQAFRDAQMATAVATRERLGLASQEEMAIVGLTQLNRDRADGFIRSDAEMEEAEKRLQRQVEESYKQEQVKNSAFKGLAGMGQQNVADDIDKLGTSTLNNLGNTIVETANNTRKGTEEWRQFGLEADRAVENLIVKLLILKPLAAGLEGIFTGGAGLFSGGVNAGNFGGTAGNLPALHALGGVMTQFGPMSLRRYAGGGVATSPQVAIYGEGSGPEAYVPLPDGRAIPVQMNGAGGSSAHVIAPTIEQHFHFAAGTTPDDAQKQMASTFARQSQDMIKQAVDDRIITHLRTGGLLNPA